MEPLQGARRTHIALGMVALVMLVLAFSPQRSWADAPHPSEGKTLSIDLRLDLGVIATAFRLSL